MPHASADGVKLYYEEAGSGTPLVFVHEFSGDLRSWEAQMRFFSRRYRCVAFNARGYPPSSVPRAASAYSQELAVEDVRRVMDHLGIRKAHVVGCSMGASTTLQFGIRHPGRTLSLTSVGAGAGANPATREAFLAATEANAKRFLKLGAAAALRATGPAAGRIPFLVKDPRGYAEFERWYGEHSGLGLANTQRGIQAKRQTVYEMEPGLRASSLPMLVVSGDEDDGSIAPALFIKRVSPGARLFVCPGAGHTVNTEEPGLFNQVLLDFLTLVDTGAWKPRDPRSLGKRTPEGSRRRGTPARSVAPAGEAHAGARAQARARPSSRGRT